MDRAQSCYDRRSTRIATFLAACLFAVLAGGLTWEKSLWGCINSGFLAFVVAFGFIAPMYARTRKGTLVILMVECGLIAAYGYILAALILVNLSRSSPKSLPVNRQMGLAMLGVGIIFSIVFLLAFRYYAWRFRKPDSPQTALSTRDQKVAPPDDES